MENGVERLIGNQKFISFRLPTPPPSMNSAYNVLFAKRRIEMKPEVRSYKTCMKMYVPKFEVGELDKVSITMTVSQDWFYKNEGMKKQDIQNMVKVLIDLIAEKQGWDDKHVWEFTVKKFQDVIHNGVYVEERILNGENGEKKD